MRKRKKRERDRTGGWSECFCRQTETEIEIYETMERKNYDIRERMKEGGRMANSCQEK